MYHALEEVEHKAVCYDLYQQAKGGYGLRVLGMLFVTGDLLVRLRNRQKYLLQQDGLWNKATEKKANQLLWGKGGIMRSLTPYLLQYFRPNFHPWETDERMDLLRRFPQEIDLIDEIQNGMSKAA